MNAHIKTLTLKEAARILRIAPETLRDKASKGKVPAAKLGKSWLFIYDDLVDFMRSGYANTVGCR